MIVNCKRLQIKKCFENIHKLPKISLGLLRPKFNKASLNMLAFVFCEFESLQD